MSKRERVAIWGVGLFLFVAAFGYTFVELAPFSGDDALPQPEEQTTILGNHAELVLRYVLDDGRMTDTKVVEVEAHLVGLTLGELQGMRPEWQIKSFAPSRIVVDIPCRPEEGSAGFLRPQDGRVAIFQGDPAGCHALKEVTKITVDGLPERVRAALDTGIPYEHESDLPQILEGLHGSM